MDDSSVCAVALSGGVDSSIASFLLKKDWESMVGASHIIWNGSRCCSAEVLNRAREVCRRLKIPYFQIDLFSEFKEKVVGNFIDTYLKGKTPNPCVVCNRCIRFDSFYNKLKYRLIEEGLLKEGQVLYFATGHYARIQKTASGYFLARAEDPLKDQTYMLYGIPKDLLPYLIFPLGDYTKSEVASLADAEGLEFTGVRESQDACFIDSSYVDFISRRVKDHNLLSPGDIVDTRGRVLGKHRGYIHYTVGQRKGLGLGNGPWYVSRINLESNSVVVARREEAQISSLLVENLNWFIEKPLSSLSCSVKIRYQTGEIPARIEPEEDQVRVILDSPEIVTPGQSAVFYADNLLLGGGTIV